MSRVSVLHVIDVIVDVQSHTVNLVSINNQDSELTWLLHLTRRIIRYLVIHVLNLFMSLLPLFLYPFPMHAVFIPSKSLSLVISLNQRCPIRP